MCAKDPHGFGFLALSNKARSATAQKWLDPNAAFVSTRDAANAFAAFEAIEFFAEASRIGPAVIDKPVSALLLHSRYATSAKGLRNNHPHCDTLDPTRAIEAGIVHNGVLETPEGALRNTLCDSEQIVWAYDETGAVRDASQTPSMVRALGAGYFAIGAVLRQASGKYLVDIVRDDQASLSALYVSELDAVVFATAPSNVIRACKRLHWKRPIVADVRENVFFRTDPITGRVVASGTVTPNKRVVVVSGPGADLPNWSYYKERQGQFKAWGG